MFEEGFVFKDLQYIFGMFTQNSMGKQFRRDEFKKDINILLTVFKEYYKNSNMEKNISLNAIILRIYIHNIKELFDYRNNRKLILCKIINDYLYEYDYLVLNSYIEYSYTMKFFNENLHYYSVRFCNSNYIDTMKRLKKLIDIKNPNFAKRFKVDSLI